MKTIIIKDKNIIKALVDTVNEKQERKLFLKIVVPKNTTEIKVTLTMKELLSAFILSYDDAMNMVNDIKEFKLNKLTPRELKFFGNIERKWKAKEYSTLTIPMTDWLNDIHNRIMVQV